MTCAYITASAMASTLVGSDFAFAHEPDKPYSMTVIVDAAQGRKVQAGHYEAAIARLTSPSARRIRDEFALHTNLCVAYLKTGNLSLAEAACESALTTIVETDRRPAYYSHIPDGAEHVLDEYRALAFSNRGVVKAIQGDTDSALADFEAAHSLNKRSRTAKSNIERLDRGRIVG